MAFKKEEFARPMIEMIRANFGDGVFRRSHSPFSIPPKATLIKGTFCRNPKTETRKARRLRHIAQSAGKRS
jgi:hypothetical protein